MDETLARLLQAQRQFQTYSQYHACLPLFHFLEGLQLTIPDTLLYRGPFLDSWYHTDEGGRVVRRLPTTLLEGAEEEVVGAFSRRAPHNSIVATWIEVGEGILRRPMDEEGDSSSTSRRRRRKKAGSPTLIPPPLDILYLTEGGLREKLRCGRGPKASESSMAILQRFVAPKGPLNHVIRAQWTPGGGLVSAAYTACPLPWLDGTAPLALRMETIDALPTQSPPPVTTPLSGTALPTTLRDALVGLADHISTASLHAARPVSLDTLWKLGGDGKLYFLLALGIEVESSREADRAVALMQRISSQEEPGGQGGLVRVGSPGVSLRPPRPHPRPFTATLALQVEAMDRASAKGVSTLSVRATNQGLLEAADAALRLAEAEAKAREVEEERVREERYQRALLLTDVRAVRRNFNPATQCPGCGEEFTEVRAIQSILPTGCSKGQTLITLGGFVAYHDTVLYAYAREPYNDSVQAAMWTGTAFDSPAAGAMAPQSGLHFLPPASTFKLGTGGGVGYYGAVLLNPPGAPPEKVAKVVARKPASPSVFKPQLPIPEFRIQDEERRLKMADTIKARDAKAKAAVDEVTTNAALETLHYMELLRAKVGVPEIPPPLSLLQPSLTPVAYRALKRDVYFTRELTHVCSRCQCVMSNVNALGGEGGLERIPYWLREGALMAAAEEGVERYEQGVVAHQHWEEGVEEEGRERERVRHQSPPPPQLTGLALLMSAGRGKVEEVLDSGEGGGPTLLDDSTMRLLTKELHSKLSLTTIQARVEKEHLQAYTKVSKGGGDGGEAVPQRQWLESVLVGEGNSVDSGGGSGDGGGDCTPDSGSDPSLASPPHPLTILSPIDAPLQILPSLQKIRNGGKNPLYPASIFPKPEGYVPTSPLTTGTSPPRSSSLPPLTAPMTPILHSKSSPKPPLHSSLSTLSDSHHHQQQQQQQQEQQQSHPSTPPSLPPVSPIGSIMERFCLANGLPSPLLSMRARSLEGDVTPPPPTVALPAYVDDSVGEWSYEGFTQPNPDTGFIAIGCVRMGGEKAHPYIAMIRKAHECELSGMVWRVKRGEAPVEGFEATPFALHLVSCRSGRGVVEWLRVWDMRKRINPLVLKALAWAEKECGVGGGEEGGSKGFAATAAAAAGGGGKATPSPSLTFLPPPSLMHTVVLQAFLPKSGRRGADRGESTVLKRVGKLVHIPPSVFLHDTPATTLPMPPPHTASRSKHIPSSFHYNLLLAALPETAALLPDTWVPSSIPLHEAVERDEIRGTSAGGGGKPLLLPSLSRPYMDVPRSHAATRGALCAHTQALYSPLKQPLFLLRRFSPSSGKVHTEKLGVEEKHQQEQEGGGGKSREAWLTFSQLCAPHRSVHPAVLYAARCRLLAFAGHSHDTREQYGFRLFPAVCGSLPNQGAVQRLIPGHFMGGRGGLDKARGFVNSHTSPAESSLSSLHLKKQTQGALLAFKEWNANNRELQALLALEDSKRGGGEGGELSLTTTTTTAITLKPTPAMQVIIPRPRAALKMQEMRPVDIKGALEMIDSTQFTTAEKEFWEGGEALGGGLLARRLVERRDGSMLHCQMWGGFPEEVGKDKAMKEAEQKAVGEFERVKGRGDSTLLARISNQGAGINAKFMYRVRLFASNTRVVTSRWVEPGDMFRPLRHPHAFDEPLDPDAPFPGNPFLDTVGHLACCGIPLAARESPIATRVCSGKDIQTWVARGETLGSLEQAKGDPFGPHASVPLGGVYLLSLWMRPAKHIPGVGGEEDPLEGGHLHGVSKGAMAWEWDEEDEGHPLRADENTTLTMVQSYAYVGGDAGHIHRQPPQRRGLPRFTLRAQYIRQPFPAWEPPSEYDHRVSQESGVRMSARMATAEFKHWGMSGNFPSSARLPTILIAEPVLNNAFPKIKFQLHGTALPWVEPCYTYAATLEDLGLTLCNPFLEALPSFKKA